MLNLEKRVKQHCCWEHTTDNPRRVTGHSSKAEVWLYELSAFLFQTYTLEELLYVCPRTYKQEVIAPCVCDGYKSASIVGPIQMSLSRETGMYSCNSTVDTGQQELTGATGVSPISMENFPKAMFRTKEEKKDIDT